MKYIKIFLLISLLGIGLNQKANGNLPFADFQLTVNPQKITNTADTNDHTVDYSGQLRGPGDTGLLLISNITGSIQFNLGNAVDGTNSAVYTSSDKVIINAKRGVLLHHKGAAGSETYSITVVADQ